MALSATLFALMNFLARLATDSASWASVASVRSLVGALVALAFARSRGQSLRPNSAQALLWRSLLGTGSMIATFYALSSRTLSLGNTVTLLNLGPIFLAILAPIFLRERTTGAVAIGIGVALAGVILVVRPAFLFGLGDEEVVHALGGPSAGVTAASAVTAALCSSIAMMMLRRVGQTESPETIAFHFSLFAGLTTSVIWAFDARIPTARDAIFMVAAGIFAGIAQLTMTRAYTLEQAARVGGVGYLGPVVSSLLGAVALHERPRTSAIIGMLLVIAGGLFVTFVRPSASTERAGRAAPQKAEPL